MSMPTDNGKDYFVKDFYERTLKILAEYQGKHDVTLIINLMVGLLIVPKERYFNSKKVSDKYVDEAILNQIKMVLKYESELDLTQILRRLRNSVSHGDMEIKAERPNVIGEQMKIGSVLFRDKNGFEAEIPIELLKSFLTNFAANVVNDKNIREGSR